MINNQQVFQEVASLETPVPLQTEPTSPVSLYDNNVVMEEQTFRINYQEEMWPAHQVTQVP